MIIPNLPAHFSALGMLMTDVRHDYVRTYYQRLLEPDYGELARIYAELICATVAATLDRRGRRGTRPAATSARWTCATSVRSSGCRCR